MPVVGITSSPDGAGYWLVASDGGIFSFGSARFYGSTGALHLNKPVVGMASTPDGAGYWLVASDGGIFAFGGAKFYGSTGNIHLNAPIVGMAVTPDGHGYWLVASDGGVFTAGDAGFYGSTANVHLNASIVGIAGTPDGRGYWMVGADGGVFTGGDAGFYGSGETRAIAQPIIGLIPSRNGDGYSLIGQSGAIYSFGNTSAAKGPSDTTEGSAPSAVPGPPPSSTPSSSMPPPTTTTDLGTGFVQRNGTALTLDGQPYRFTGIDIYQAASGGTPSSCGGELYPNVGVPLSQMPRGIVIRVFAFQNFFVSGAGFNWTNLDQVLSIAASYDDKVILVLADQWDYCDGPQKDLTWYQNGYDSTVTSGNIVTYRQYVADIVSRYADNPTVAMWQLVNEGEAFNTDETCNEAAALSALLAFSNDVGGLIHSIDLNHLVSLGTLEGWSGGGRMVCGSQGSDYQTLMASPGNDVCDYHDYGYPGDPMGNPSQYGLQTAINQCQADDKPIMVAETGIYADNSGALEQRATEFQAKLSAQFQAGVVGELLWAWVVAPSYVLPDSDPDYGISAGDPSLKLLGTSYPAPAG
jgi:hypothetical protein